MTSATSGATCFWGYKNLICVLGRENKQLTVYSSKRIGTDPCTLENNVKLKSIQLDG